MTTKITRSTLAAALVITALYTSGCAGVGVHGGRRPAPAFTAEVVSGVVRDTVRLDEFRGRPLVLNIGAIWCPHCLNEVPAFNAAYEKYKGDVTILVVFIKSERKAVDEMVEERKPGFIIALDQSSDIGRAYGIKGIPATFFIDSEGVITDEYVGGLSERRLTDKIEALRARPAR